MTSSSGVDNENKEKKLEMQEFSVHDKVSALWSDWQGFSLHEKVSQTTNNINKQLVKVPKFALPELRHETTTEIFKRPFYEISDDIHTNYPYFTTLSKNHGYTFVVASTLIAALSLRSKFCTHCCLV